MSVEIIADIGVNHDGYLVHAETLVEECKDIGVDFVKFQVWRKNRWPDIEHLRLNKDQLLKLFNLCEAIEQPWFATAFDIDSIEFLKRRGQKIWKVPSGLAHNLTYLAHIFDISDRVIVSCGLIDTSEFEIIGRMARDFSKYKDNEMTLDFLYCVSKYPAPLDEINLCKSVMYNGISDHSGLPEIPIAAIALGAKIVECHITMNPNNDGPDHRASLCIEDFKYMINAVRNVQKATTETEYEFDYGAENIRKLDEKNKIRKRMQGI